MNEFISETNGFERQRERFMYDILNFLLNDSLRIKFILAREEGTGNRYG